MCMYERLHLYCVKRKHHADQEIEQNLPNDDDIMDFFASQTVLLIVFLINFRWRARQRALLWPSVFYSTPPGPQHWFAAYTGSAHKINHIHRCEENIDEVGHWRHCHHFLSSKRL